MVFFVSYRKEKLGRCYHFEDLKDATKFEKLLKRREKKASQDWGIQLGIWADDAEPRNVMIWTFGTAMMMEILG